MQQTFWLCRHRPSLATSINCPQAHGSAGPTRPDGLWWAHLQCWAAWGPCCHCRREKNICRATTVSAARWGDASAALPPPPAGNRLRCTTIPACTATPRSTALLLGCNPPSSARRNSPSRAAVQLTQCNSCFQHPTPRRCSRRAAEPKVGRGHSPAADGSVPLLAENAPKMNAGTPWKEAGSAPLRIHSAATDKRFPTNSVSPPSSTLTVSKPHYRREKD